MTLDELARYLERVQSRHFQASLLPLPDMHVLDMAYERISPLARELLSAYLETAHLLGQRTADMHMALAQDTDDPDFVPEPFSDFFQRPFYHAAVGLIDRDLQVLRRELANLPDTTREVVNRVIAREHDIRSFFVPFRDRKITAMRIRCHGNYTLGKVLLTDNDLVITNFAGDPSRSLDERRIKVSPLRDVARMLRSFHYAIHEAVGRQQRREGQYPPGTQTVDQQAQASWIHFWYSWASARFLRGYLDTISQSPLLLQTREECKIMLDAYLLEQTLHELSQELGTRPELVIVPLRGMLHVLESPPLREAGTSRT
jgi:maltose alpha-D-glucosyltransferase/alpha-amylase